MRRLRVFAALDITWTALDDISSAWVDWELRAGAHAGTHSENAVTTYSCANDRRIIKLRNKEKNESLTGNWFNWVKYISFIHLFMWGYVTVRDLVVSRISLCHWLMLSSYYEPHITISKYKANFSWFYFSAARADTNWALTTEASLFKFCWHVCYYVLLVLFVGQK